MQTYEQYKESGIDWIGQIPEHWGIKRLKYLFNEINERSIDGSEDLLSVSQYTGVTKKSEKIDDGDLLTNASTLEGYKKVRKHQLVSNIMLAWNGSLAFSEYNGITSPAYCIYELKHDDVYKYFHYLFKTDLYKSEFKRNSSGVIESRLRLYTDDFFLIWSVLPPIHEQEAIANFLDEKTAKIDALVQTKEQQIEKLKELRQAKIHQAVTKGLDANAPTKDSGVEWIGEIPAHWVVKRLKNELKYFKGYAFSSNDFKDNGIPIVKASNIKNNTIKNISSYISLDNQKKDFEKFKLKKGDIIISTVGSKPEMIDSAVGQLAFVSFEFENSYLNQNTVCFRLINSINIKEYFKYIFQSKYIRNYFDRICLWIANQAYLEVDEILNIDLILPPIQEQEQIVAYLDEVTGKIDQAIAQKQEQITKLKEYKQSLINDVVTGKVRVC